MADIDVTMSLDPKGVDRGLDAVERREQQYVRRSERRLGGHISSLSEAFEKLGADGAAVWARKNGHLAETEKRAKSLTRRVGDLSKRTWAAVGGWSTLVSGAAAGVAGAMAIASAAVDKYNQKWAFANRQAEEHKKRADSIMLVLGRSVSRVGVPGSGLSQRFARELDQGPISDVARLVNALGFMGGDGSIDETDALVRQLETMERGERRRLANRRLDMRARALGASVRGDDATASEIAARLEYEDAARGANEDQDTSSNTRAAYIAAARARLDEAERRAGVQRQIQRRRGLDGQTARDAERMRLEGDEFGARRLDARARYFQAGDEILLDGSRSDAERRAALTWAQEIYQLTLGKIRAEEKAMERAKRDEAQASLAAEHERERVIDGEIRLLEIGDLRARGKKDEAEREKIIYEFAERRRRVEELSVRSIRERKLARLGALETAALARVGIEDEDEPSRGLSVSQGRDASIRRQVLGTGASVPTEVKAHHRRVAEGMRRIVDAIEGLERRGAGAVVR